MSLFSIICIQPMPNTEEDKATRQQVTATVKENVTLVDLTVYIFVRLVTRGRYAQCHSQFNNLSEF